MLAETMSRRPAAIAALAALLLVVAVACGSGRRANRADSHDSVPPGTQSSGPIPVGKSTRTITVGRQARTYHLYRPSTLANPAPLVVLIHGGFGSGEQAEANYGWDQQADKGHFLVAYPDGLNKAWNVGGGCCGKSARRGVDDVGFITQMVEAVEHATPVDATRVYATGMSNGAIMDYTLACKSDLFAAIGPVSGTQLSDCQNPKPISIIHIHGLADDTIPFNAGTGKGPAHIDGPAIPTLNAQWRSIDGCGPPTVTTAGPVTTSVASCSSGHTVELITVAGAGHQWPGSAPKSSEQQRLRSDPPSSALNATQTIWQFFSTHAK